MSKIASVVQLMSSDDGLLAGRHGLLDEILVDKIRFATQIQIGPPVLEVAENACVCGQEKLLFNSNPSAKPLLTRVRAVGQPNAKIASWNDLAHSLFSLDEHLLHAPPDHANELVSIHHRDHMLDSVVERDVGLVRDGAQLHLSDFAGELL